MKKIAILILFIGLFFCFTTLRILGTDLLIDAVGWLLVFNATNALKKLNPQFSFAPQMAIVLTIVCGAQMFLFGNRVLTATAFLRCALEIIFFIFTLRGFLKLYDGKKQARVLAVVLFVFAIVASVVFARSTLVAI